MENLNDLKLLHEKVQSDIFRILVKYKILNHTCSTVKSRSPLYFFTDEYKFMFTETPTQIGVFLESIDRLLETGFLIIISDKKYPEFIYLITKSDLENLLEKDKSGFNVLHDKTISKLLSRYTTLTSGVKLCNDLF